MNNRDSVLPRDGEPAGQRPEPANQTAAPQPRLRVLVVEDDDSIAAALAEGLTRYGYQVDHVGTGAEALNAPDAQVVLLDLGLPDMDGTEVCRGLRANSDVPIIVITARAAEADTVIGLELGADDYMTKPFGVRELVARIRAVTRRYRPGHTEETLQRLGELTIDRRSHRVHLAGEEVAMTPKEFDVLALLAEQVGAAFTREQIMEAVWRDHHYGRTKTLDVHVAAIRRKVGAAVAIETVRGVGFRLEHR